MFMETPEPSHRQTSSNTFTLVDSRDFPFLKKKTPQKILPSSSFGQKMTGFRGSLCENSAFHCILLSLRVSFSFFPSTWKPSSPKTNDCEEIRARVDKQQVNKYHIPLCVCVFIIFSLTHSFASISICPNVCLHIFTRKSSTIPSNDFIFNEIKWRIIMLTLTSFFLSFFLFVYFFCCLVHCFGNITTHQ